MIKRYTVCKREFEDPTRNGNARTCGEECRRVITQARWKRYYAEHGDELNRKHLEAYHQKAKMLVVVADPDPEIGLLPGLELSRAEVDAMSRFGSFSPGTILAAETGQRYQVYGDIDSRQQLVRLEA